jgi:hypothetical protein
VVAVALLVVIGSVIPSTTLGDKDETLQGWINPLESLTERPTKEEIKQALVFISQEYSVNEICSDAIVRCESHYENVCNFEYGCIGGIGYYQLLQKTAQYCSEKMGKDIDPYNPKDNLECGTWLLKNEGTRHWGTEFTWWGSWDCWNKYCK